MATTSRPLPPLPAANEPVVSPNGLINPAWYQWLKAAEQIIKILRTEV
jgi:hypothetical protein